MGKRNDVELLAAGQEAHYELEISAQGTIFEPFCIWEDADERAGSGRSAVFAREEAGVLPWEGAGFPPNLGGPRLAFRNLDLPGLRHALCVDRAMNRNRGLGRGWTVEPALPWAGSEAPATPDGRALPRRDAGIWRTDFRRFNYYTAAPPATGSSGWACSPHGVRESHAPGAVHQHPVLQRKRMTCPCGNRSSARGCAAGSRGWGDGFSSSCAVPPQLEVERAFCRYDGGKNARRKQESTTTHS